MTTLACSSKYMNSTDVFGKSWEGRRVAVIGLGKSGLAAAELLCRLGCKVSATDAADNPSLNQARIFLQEQGVIKVELGEHSSDLIEQSELAVLSPGVSESAPPVQLAKRLGIALMSEIELAFHFCPSPIVAVTGTNGKSSSVTLIADLLKASGRHVVACGNLGIPFSSIVGQLGPDSIAVVEVSSFQLLQCRRFRPFIGVLLNLGINHLDRHEDLSDYHQAKTRLYQAQGPGDWAVLNGADKKIREQVGVGLKAQCVWFGEDRTNPLGFSISPNMMRIFSPVSQAALQVGRIFGIPDPLVWQIIKEFRGLEHRLEYVTAVRGREFINDSKSTTPDSLLFALQRVQGRIVLIMGGRDKRLDMGGVVQAIKDERIIGVVLIGESRKRLADLLNHNGMNGTKIEESGTMEEAVHAAWRLAAPGTKGLLSPAHSSFDMFRSFEERGHTFKRIVDQLYQGFG